MIKKCIVILIAAVLIFTRGGVEPENKNYILVLYMDKVEDGIMAVYGFADFDSYTGQSTAEDNNMSKIILGESVEEIEGKYYKMDAKLLDYAHIEALILGDNLIEDKNMLRDTLDYLKREAGIRNDVYVYMAHSGSSDVSAIDGIMGKELNTAYDNNAEYKNLMTADFKKLYGHIYDGDEVSLAVVKIDEEYIYVDDVYELKLNE